ncbi:BatD family protein [Vibrio sp. 10N.261.51.F12]|uniref:BatD family protein n=1 Tax=Vibrio sp. 10N.261.51.F12 TaxID=3229679 RepID=UPI00354F0F7A
MIRNKLHPVFLMLILLVSGFVSFPSWALTVTASVNKTKVSKDEVIQLRVVADEKLDGSKVSFDSLSHDFYTGRANFSSSVNILNGSRTDSSVWTIAIAPQRIGKIVIPSFDVNGAKTTPITLDVTIDEQTPTTDDMIEVRTQIGKQVLYPKESTILDARIIVKVDPRLLQNPDLIQPTAQGVTLKALGEPKQYQAVLDGIDVLIIDQQYRVTAESAGTFTIQAPTLSGGVLYGNNRSGTTKILTLNHKAPALALTVQPIPADYQGVWLPSAKLTLAQSWQRSDGSAVSSNDADIDTGDSLTRTVTLNAMGVTSNQLPNLSIENPDGFRVYPEKPTFNDNDDGSVTMTIKQVLIAKKEGQYPLPAIAVDWWNTTTNKKDQSALSGLLVTVHQSDEPSVGFKALNSTPTTTVSDSGFWPYLTGLFACLWLVSSVMWYRARRNSAKSQSASETPKNTDSKPRLLEAINRRDAIAAQSAFHLWVKESKNLSPDTVNSIQSELSAMSRAEFMGNESSWDSTAVITLISKASSSTPPPHLAHL